MRYLSEIFWGHTWDVCTLAPNFLNVCQSVPDDICFWIFLETLLGCWYTCSKWFWTSCMSVSLSVGLLSYLILAYIWISPVLDEISFWLFLDRFLGCVRSVPVRSGQFRSCHFRSGQVRSGQVRSGRITTDQISSSHVRQGQFRSGQVRSLVVYGMLDHGCQVRMGRDRSC